MLSKADGRSRLLKAEWEFWARRGTLSIAQWSYFVFLIVFDFGPVTHPPKKAKTWVETTQSRELNIQIVAVLHQVLAHHPNNL